MNSHNNKNFNELIIENGGRDALLTSRSWQKTKVNIAKYREHLTFNIKCRQNEVIPKTVQVKSFDNYPLSHKIAKRASLDFVKVRIIECRKKLKYLNKLEGKLMLELITKLPKTIVNELIY